MKGEKRTVAKRLEEKLPPATYAPRLATDCVVFGLDEGALKVLLEQRALSPFEGCWALPGGFVRQGESVDDCARRELHEETGLQDVFLEQLYTFGDEGRDPRGHVVSVAYYALTHRAGHRLTARTDAREAAWFDASSPPELAFDHQEILESALERLRGKARYRPIGFALLPETFTLGALQGLYETLLGVPLDKRNFRKKVQSLGLLKETALQDRSGPGRPARLYRFDRRRYQQLVRDGFEMWI